MTRHLYRVHDKTKTFYVIHKTRKAVKDLFPDALVSVYDTVEVNIATKSFKALTHDLKGYPARFMGKHFVGVD